MKRFLLSISVLTVVSVCYATTVFMSGFESGVVGHNQVSTEGWNDVGTTGVSIDSVTVRSGKYSLRCNATSGAACYAENRIAFDINGKAYKQVYMYIASTPTIMQTVIYLANGSSGRGNLVYITPSRKLVLSRTGVGLDSTTTILPMNVWIRVQVACYIINSTPTFSVELKVLGETKTTNVALTNGSPEDVNYISYGKRGTEAGTYDIYFDDDITNDTQTSDHNSYEPFECRLLMLHPIADDTLSHWTDGAGGTMNIYKALTVPMSGRASETSTTNIKDVSAVGQDVYRVKSP